MVGSTDDLSEDTHSSRYSHSQTRRHIAPQVDGAINPDQIPDLAAYEIVFRLLTAPHFNDPDGSRKRVYTRHAGFDEAEAVALFNAAYEYKLRIEPLDALVDDIKNAHWPNPSQQVMNQLAQLQAQKESVIAEVVAALQARLNNHNPLKFRRYVDGQVKRKTEGFGSRLPSKKVSAIKDFFSNLFTASAQASCDSQIYIYVNTYADMDNLMVYGDGSYSMPYNNCGHTITLSAEMSIPGGGSVSGYGGSAEYGLDQGGTLIDGYFLATVEADYYCPVVNETYYGGRNADATIVAPYIKLVGFQSVTPTIITYGSSSTTTATVSFRASIDAAGKAFYITPDVEFTSGDLRVDDLNTNPSSGASVTVSGISFTIQYTVMTAARSGKFKPGVRATSGTVEVLPPTDVQSSTQVSVNGG